MRKVVLSRRLYRICFALIIVAIVTATIILLQKESPSYPMNKVVQFSFNIQNTGSSLLKDVDFSVYAPVNLTSIQKVKEIDASHPFELEQDNLQNQIMRFMFKEIAPYETRVVRIRAEVSLASTPNFIDSFDPGQFKVPEKYIESDDPLIQTKASKLKGNNSEETIKNVFNWVSQTIQYSGYIEEDRGALYALQNRHGDCTEYMYLMNALLRANGIPARSIGGYLIPQDATVRGSDYHNWSEVFMGKKWHVIDPQNGKFMQDQSSYIAMRVITDSPLLINSHRFAYSNSSIKVTMN